MFSSVVLCRVNWSTVPKFVNPPYQAGTPVKLFFKLPYKNFKLYILINFKRKSEYLKVVKLLAFATPGPVKEGREKFLGVELSASPLGPVYKESFWAQSLQEPHNSGGVGACSRPWLAFFPLREPPPRGGNLPQSRPGAKHRARLMRAPWKEGTGPLVLGYVYPNPATKKIF